MKTGTKIIVTNSPYEPNVPNGSIMTVTHVHDEGSVQATVDGVDGFNWFMDAGSFKEYTPDLPHGHVTLLDGRTVDLTANRVRCDLMDPDELQAMKDHGGPYEVRGIEGWIWMHFDPAWDYHNTYRVTPKPAVSAASATETVVMTGHKFNNEWYFNSLHKDVRHTHRITLTIQDGKIIDTKTEEL